MDSARTSSRRQFLCGAAAAPFVAAARPFVVDVAGAERTRTKIRDLQVLMLQGPGRTYTLVKITADSGHSGIAEAYGSPGVGPYIQDGFIRVTDKPGLGIELNPDVVRAHLAPGETWWG